MHNIIEHLKYLLHIVEVCVYVYDVLGHDAKYTSYYVFILVY